MLQNKNAVIYGAGGSLGGAVARSLAKAGAKVFLSGHHIVTVQKTADEILSLGGYAQAAMVDAMDETAVNNYIEKIVADNKTVDICFNAIGLDAIQNVPLIEMSPADFTRPITISMQTQFITAKAAGSVMMKQQSGVILSLTATPGGIGYPLTGGFGTACCAIESFSRQLAAELGVYGIRVVNIRSAGSPDSRVFKQAIEMDEENMKPILKMMEADTMLKALPLMEDIANVACFLASDLAGKITGVTVDVTSGTTSALNYRTGGSDR